MTERCVLLCAFVGAFFLIGCGYQGAVFSGQTRSQRATSQQIDEQPSLPTGYRTLGQVRAECDREEPAFGELEKGETSCRSLGELMCSEELLAGALREKAADVGGTVLVGRQCQSSSSSDETTITCAAEVAAAEDEAAPVTAAKRAAVSETVPLRSAGEAWEIDVKFTALQNVARATRSSHLVNELAEKPPQNIVLGDLFARCGGDCSNAALRESLRVAAGRVGASDVVGVRCLHKGDDMVCSARATAPIADPRVVAAAR